MVQHWVSIGLIATVAAAVKSMTASVKVDESYFNFNFTADTFMSETEIIEVHQRQKIKTFLFFIFFKFRKFVTGKS